MNLRDQLGPGLGSLEELRVMAGVERPASVKEMLARYGAADQNLSDFNPEQRASIVDEWFAGSGSGRARSTRRSRAT